MARGEYGDVHRAVLQTFMSKKFMTEKDAIELVQSFSRCAPCVGAPTAAQAAQPVCGEGHDAMQRATSAP